MMNLWNQRLQQAALPFIVACLYSALTAQAQQAPLLLSDAIKTGLANYQTIKAKQRYLDASTALVQNVKNEYLPNIIAGLQHNYGTVNGQFGPLAPVGLAGVSSAGPATNKQNWTAAFGSLYVINTNWESFTFGRKQSRIDAANAQVKKDSADLVQEQFIQSIKITSAYLNLLVAQRLIQNAQSNLDRAAAVKNAVRARTLSGLNPGVDSSIANAEVSKATLVLIDATGNEQQLSNLLVQLLNITPTGFTLDSSFLKNIPSTYNTGFDVAQNPQLQFYASRIQQSNLFENVIKRTVLPGVNLFGIVQTRGSGFEYNYSSAFPDRYSKNYFDGIKPSRTNYIAGFSVSWNIMSLVKIKQQATAQHFITKAYENEYDLVNTQLKDQLVLADQRIENALQVYKEVPRQYKAAADAYLQKTVLYKNGLTNIIDLQQALYAVNKAETDISVAYINVWQALLLKTAASGDLDLFLNQVK
jgi:outer membrane protein TolC